MAVDMVGVLRIVGCPTELSVAIPIGRRSGDEAGGGTIS